MAPPRECTTLPLMCQCAHLHTRRRAGGAGTTQGRHLARPNTIMIGHSIDGLLAAQSRARRPCCVSSLYCWAHRKCLLARPRPAGPGACVPGPKNGCLTILLALGAAMHQVATESWRTYAAKSWRGCRQIGQSAKPPARTVLTYDRLDPSTRMLFVDANRRHRAGPLVPFVRSPGCVRIRVFGVRGSRHRLLLLVVTRFCVRFRVPSFDGRVV